MKTVVVTGGSAGIGLATAERFARSGWRVAIIARDRTRLAEARALLERHGGKVLAISADVADAEAVAAAADRVAAELGGIDAWVNNVMSTVIGLAQDVTPHEYARVTATTYLSQVHGTLAALRHMRAANQGVIVQVSSALAIRPAPLQAAYCGAKAAVGAFTEALRTELLVQGVGVKLGVIYLPAVNTPQPDWSRTRTGRAQVIPDPLFDPRLCAEAVWSAVRDPQREIWVGRSTVMAALGKAVAPGLSDRRATSMLAMQQGDPMPPRDGNLDAPVPGPARIDGRGTGRMVRSRHEFFTTRHRTALQAGMVGGLLLIGGALGLGLAHARPTTPKSRLSKAGYGRSA